MFQVPFAHLLDANSRLELETRSDDSFRMLNEDEREVEVQHLRVGKFLPLSSLILYFLKQI